MASLDLCKGSHVSDLWLQKGSVLGRPQYPTSERQENEIQDLMGAEKSRIPLRVLK
jgi:hypothetical protein